MICTICGKISSHTSDINIKKFVVDGITYMYPVCLDNGDFQHSHKDEQQLIADIVHKEQAKAKELKDRLEQDRKELLAKQEADAKANQERVARDIEEMSYRTAMHNFNDLVQGNKRAMRDIYKMLKDAYDGGKL